MEDYDEDATKELVFISRYASLPKFCIGEAVEQETAKWDGMVRPGRCVSSRME